MKQLGRMPIPWRLRAQLILSSVAINSLMLVLPIATLQIYDRVLTHPESGTLLMLALGVCGAVLLETALRLARARVTSGIAQAYEQRHSERLMAHVLAAWVRSAQQRHSGEYVQALGAIGRMREYAMQRLIALSVDVPYLLLFLCLLGVVGGILVVVPLLAVTLFTTLVLYWGVQSRHAIHARNLADERRYGFILEALGGIHVIKSMGLEPRFSGRFRSLQLESGRHTLMIAWLNHMLANGGAMFSQAMVVLVVACGAPLVLQGKLTMGELIACVLLSGRLVQPLQHALVCWMGYQEYEQARAQIGRITSLPLQEFYAAHELHHYVGRVVVERLSFHYSEEEPSVLEHVSFTLEPGEAVLLAGDVNSGRSTLIKLLAGLLEPTQGRVWVDGANPARLLPQQLARHIACLTPEPVLLRGTILQNITGYDPALNERAQEIARLIGLDQLIAQLPGGYETLLDGGQEEMIPPGFRQRVAIARALLHKPKLILFDQADRSLDREGYHQLFRLLARVKGRATLLLVSDDQNLARLCDRTLRLRAGRLMPVLSGPPRLQLVTKRG